MYRTVVLMLSDANFDMYSIINRALPFVVGIFGFVVAVSMLKESCYILTDTQMITKFGILESKYEIGDIEKIHLFEKTQKLTVYFRGGKYMVIVVKEEWYQEFIEELLKRNKGIFYSKSEEETV